MALMDPPSKMEELVRKAQARGFTLASMPLETAPSPKCSTSTSAWRLNTRAARFRIEHAQHMRAEDFARFARLGVIASMQPYHAIDDGRWARRK